MGALALITSPGQQHLQPSAEEITLLSIEVKMKLVLPYLGSAFALSHGTVDLHNDSLAEAGASSNIDLPLASSFTRPDDKLLDFLLHSVKVDFNFLDNANKLKGGQLRVEIDNFKKYFPKTRIDKLEFEANIDVSTGGVIRYKLLMGPTDQVQGKVNLKVILKEEEYAVKIHAERSVTLSHVTNVQDFDLHLKSNLRTIFEAKVLKGQGANLFDLKLQRIPRKSIVMSVKLGTILAVKVELGYNSSRRTAIGKAEVAIHRRKYTVEVPVYFASAKDFMITGHLDGKDGKELVSVKLFTKLFTSGVRGGIIAQVNVTDSGTAEAKLSIKPHDSILAFSIKQYRGPKLVEIAMAKGLITHDTPGIVKADVNYNAQGIVGSGQLQLLYEGLVLSDRTKLGLKYLPQSGPNMAIDARTEFFRNGTHTTALLITTDDTVHFQYVRRADISYVGHNFQGMREEATLFLGTELFRPGLFCLFMCANEYKHLFSIELGESPLQTAFALQSIHDGTTVFDVDWNSLKNPYYFNFTKPRFLHSGVHDSVQLTADYEHDQHFKIIFTSLPSFESLIIEKTSINDTNRDEFDASNRIEYGASLNGEHLATLIVDIMTDDDDDAEVLLTEGQLRLFNGLSVAMLIGNGGLTSNSVTAQIEHAGDQTEVDVVAEWNLEAPEPSNWTYTVGLEGLLQGKSVTWIHANGKIVTLEVGDE